MVATIVFLDIEATGVPEEENNQCKITELSLIAVKKHHLTSNPSGTMPRVQQKMTLCFNPNRTIRPTASTMSKLTNELLANESKFDGQACDLINSFLKILEQPVCLVAHFGTGMDFPVLKNHFSLSGRCLPDGLMYTDSLNFFRYKLKGKGLESFSLKGVYKFLLKCEPSQSHRAEDDCVTVLKAVGVVAAEFVQWVNHHSYPFNEIKAMTVGVSVKDTRRVRL